MVALYGTATVHGRRSSIGSCRVMLNCCGVCNLIHKCSSMYTTGVSCLLQNLISGFPTIVDTSQAVQPQKTQEEERLYFLCSENKGADQLRGYRASDLRLCFPI